MTCGWSGTTPGTPGVLPRSGHDRGGSAEAVEHQHAQELIHSPFPTGSTHDVDKQERPIPAWSGRDWLIIPPHLPRPSPYFHP